MSLINNRRLIQILNHSLTAFYSDIKYLNYFSEEYTTFLNNKYINYIIEEAFKLFETMKEIDLKCNTLCMSLTIINIKI